MQCQKRPSCFVPSITYPDIGDYQLFRHYFLSRTEVVLCAKQEIRQTQETARREKAEATKGKLYDY